ncbi:hypothetical protein L0636_10990 [Halomonas janggokensis]|uniref:Uncharacterized protein n=1 Tax=Vreelandella janggokensis TaxID=370767 RepID=A0ABT4IQN7_9GAMM|nr:hypothetical protein [Halomonas janggokensis]MCZ0925878.1 hypothetical protein [Halomonas janggokensis]MCZ0930945.1 hypothetical protein [Halomonas janggokensis]
MGITRTFSRCYTTYFSLGENQDIAWNYVVKPIEGIEATAGRVAFGGGSARMTSLTLSGSAVKCRKRATFGYAA